jgi:DNA-binding CsgD family transcriptional regulator
MQFAEALCLFREAWSEYRTCADRDAAFEASIVHAVAMYDLQLLQCDRPPEYFTDSLPQVRGSSLDTYRLLVSRVDAMRAALHGDVDGAIHFAATTVSTDVSSHWRTLVLVTQAAVAQAFGDNRLARAYCDVAFDHATSLDWNEGPGESRFALLYLAECLAAHDPKRASALLATFSRISTNVEARFFGGNHLVHQATENVARGTVALELGSPSGRTQCISALEIYQQLGFPWRAAAVQLLLGRGSSPQEKQAYGTARTFIVDCFPQSYLARQLHDYAVPYTAGASPALTQAHLRIVRALCAGASPRSIADERGISVGTVYNHLKEIYRRTDLHSIGAVVARYGRATA